MIDKQYFEENWITYTILFFIILIVSESAAYFWHRFAHINIYNPVRETHKIHHMAELDHEAHEDFIWIIVLLILYGISLYILYSKSYINKNISLILYIPVLVVFVWNWYIHSAYHQKNHWLEKYTWFQNDRRLHFQHHINPKTNFSIASHYMDEILDTFDYNNSVNTLR